MKAEKRMRNYFRDKRNQILHRKDILTPMIIIALATVKKQGSVSSPYEAAKLIMIFDKKFTPGKRENFRIKKTPITTAAETPNSELLIAGVKIVSKSNPNQIKYGTITEKNSPVRT